MHGCNEGGQEGAMAQFPGDRIT